MWMWMWLWLRVCARFPIRFWRPELSCSLRLVCSQTQGSSEQRHHSFHGHHHPCRGQHSSRWGNIFRRGRPAHFVLPRGTPFHPISDQPNSHGWIPSSRSSMLGPLQASVASSSQPFFVFDSSVSSSHSGCVVLGVKVLHSWGRCPPCSRVFPSPEFLPATKATMPQDVGLVHFPSV